METLIDHRFMEISGGILSKVLKLSENILQFFPLSAADLDYEIEKYILSCDSVPAFKGYNGYKYSSCISINSEVVHGLPTKNKIIRKGDIVSVDTGVSYKGHYTDAARTFVIGGSKSELVNTTKIALDEAIKVATVDSFTGTIGFAVQLIAELNGYKVPVSLGGHGIGLVLHSKPFVPNYGVRGSGSQLFSGEYLAIEPILFSGSADIEESFDGWTVVSPTGVLSAHFEDTIHILPDGPKILTRGD